MSYFDIILAMNGEREFKIGLTDEELVDIHHGVRDNLPSNPFANTRHRIAELLPNPVKRIIIPENKDTLTALPMLGRQLASVLITDSHDIIYHDNEKDSREFLAFCFAAQACRIGALEIGIETKRQPTDYDPFAQQLDVSGKVLAAIFTSENFTPELGRHTLETMAPRIDDLVHPGRKKLREAMEAVREKYESVK